MRFEPTGGIEKRINHDIIFFVVSRVWFSGRTSGCQSDDGSSILPTRTKIMK